jgi:beta-mannosidase
MATRKKPQAAGRLRRITLSGRWTLEGAWPRGESIKVPARVPGVVHWDLQRAGIIQDPFEGAVEDAVKWVALQPWTYRRVFRVSAKALEARHVELVFDGLDTFAEITLNGTLVGKTDNMFIPHRFDVKSLLFAGDNEIAVTFLSPVEEGLKLHQEHNSVKLYEGDGNPRAYVRKAQYSYGWDWGPKITTSGIWRGVRIETWDSARIESVYWRTLKASPEGARVAATVEVTGTGRSVVSACLYADGHSLPVRLSRRKTGTGFVFSGVIDIENPMLWWPAGQGGQDLYEAEVILESDGARIDRHQSEVGLRTVNLKREKDDEGESFIIEVNGREVFCKGADWIPADIYLPRITQRDYDAWVRMAAGANMNMLRVWGGGIYEPDDFYAACDRSGIMVWQDFMFACAMYPEDEWFTDMVAEEAKSVVKALRNHPSIVLWCGNNENHWAARSWWPNDPFGGKTVYEKVLPSAVKRFDPSRPYWPSSPYGGKDPNSEAQGDRHDWDVWSGWKDYSLYLKDKGRFLSEYGWQAAPAMETVAKFGPVSKLHPQHPLFERHNKQAEGGERLARFLAGSFRMPKTIAEYVHLTQVLQAEAIKAGSLHWRTRMMKTSGALYWQLNDCWPVVSWAAVDYARRPKALYYYTRRFFAPVAVWVVSTPEGIFAYVVNDSTCTAGGELAVQALTFDGVEVGCVRESVEVKANGVHKVGPLKPELLGVRDPSSVFLAATLKQADGGRVVDTGFLVRPKHLQLPDPRLAWKLTGLDGALKVRISARRLAYGVYLRLPGTEARFSDNFLTLLPGQTVEVNISGSRLVAASAGKKLEVSWVHGGL